MLLSGNVYLFFQGALHILVFQKFKKFIAVMKKQQRKSDLASE